MGAANAKKISAEAEKILARGGLTTLTGRNLLRKFDEKLRDPDHKLNPGTTADITEAVLAVSILKGYRP